MSKTNYAKCFRHEAPPFPIAIAIRLRLGKPPRSEPTPPPPAETHHPADQWSLITCKSVSEPADEGIARSVLSHSPHLSDGQGLRHFHFHMELYSLFPGKLKVLFGESLNWNKIFNSWSTAQLPFVTNISGMNAYKNCKPNLQAFYSIPFVFKFFNIYSCI